MNITRNHSFLKLLCFIGLAMVLNGCSSGADPWTKGDSPWDQRKSSNATNTEAPAADTYKADLEMPEQSGNEVELSYQTESVESFAPEAVADEPVEAAVLVAADDAEVSEDSIMSHPANYFTVQLMASVDIDRAIRFADENQVSTQYIVATERDGVIWHVLLLDVYPDYSSAKVASDEIAPSLKNAPWIRRVGSVQKLVN